MTAEQRNKNLTVPEGRIDVVLDTDAYNEIDDQFAIAYLLRSGDKLNTCAIYAAPFKNENSEGPADGMEKSYHEIRKLLGLMGLERDVYRGACAFMSSETEPIPSDAARDLAARVEAYSPEHPLYVVAIGAITNVASAILLNPRVAQNAVVVWLGGHARHFGKTDEFNMAQDIAAARVVMGSGVPFVQLPCLGVVSEFRLSGAELAFWLAGKNPLADYLAKNTVAAAEKYAHGKPWTRVIWDVTAVAWLLNDKNRFMRARREKTLLPTYESFYEATPQPHDMAYVYFIHRDALMEDLIRKITKE